MIKRKFLAIFVAVCLLLSAVGVPALAIAEDSSTVSSSTSSSTQDIGSGQQALQSDTTQNSTGGDSGQSAGITQQGSTPGTTGNDGGSSSSPDQTQQSPGGSAGEQPATTTQPVTTTGIVNGVTVNTSEVSDVSIENSVTAISGNSSAVGASTNNTVTNALSANANGDSSTSQAQNQGGATASNSVSQTIENTGTAGAASGNATVVNVTDNTVNVLPETTATVNLCGEIVDSTVTVSIYYNYWAGIFSLALAQSGESSATGLSADNMLSSTATASALSDSPLIQNGGLSDGSALAANVNNNTVTNDGSALAYSGNAYAENTMLGNIISIMPYINTLVNLCGNIVNSNVTIELIYNFWAFLYGGASATTGNATAVGTDVTNDISSNNTATAMGDAPAIARDGTCSDGSASAINETSNTVSNIGTGAAVSGDAQATNVMQNNSVTIAPNLTSELDFLNSILNSDVTVRITYNIYGGITGSATAATGDAYAAGVTAANTIESSSSATALGDSIVAPSNAASFGLTDGEAAALNTTNNTIYNTGDAASVSGDAVATNIMTDNKVQITPEISMVMVVAKPIIDNGKVVIDVVYNIWAFLSGSADATSGDAISAGTISTNSIQSNSDALAFANIAINDPNGGAAALNSTTNTIGNIGSGTALSGDAVAISNLKEASIIIDGALGDNLVVLDETVTGSTESSLSGSTVEETVTIDSGATIDQVASATSGNAIGVGNEATSAVESNCIADARYGESSASNKVVNDVFNAGSALAITGNVFVFVGTPFDFNTNNGGQPAIGGSTLDNGQDQPGAGCQPKAKKKRGYRTKIAYSAYKASYNDPSLDDLSSSMESGSQQDWKGSGSQIGRHRSDNTAKDSTSTSLWVWIFVAALLSVWAGITLKFKPWKSVGPR